MEIQVIDILALVLGIVIGTCVYFWYRIDILTKDNEVLTKYLAEVITKHTLLSVDVEKYLDYYAKHHNDLVNCHNNLVKQVFKRPGKDNQEEGFNGGDDGWKRGYRPDGSKTDEDY